MNETQKSKLLSDIPDADIVIKMECNVVCPYLLAGHIEDWSLKEGGPINSPPFIIIMFFLEF